MKRENWIFCCTLFLLYSGQCLSQGNIGDVPNPTIEDTNKYIEQNGPNKLCENEFEKIPLELCNEALTCAAQSISANNCDEEKLKETASKSLKKPEFLNSALSKWTGNNTPFGFEFKSLESEQKGEMVLGLTYDIDYSFFDGSGVKSSTNYIVEQEGSFKAAGTITEDSDKNPRNFLETKLNLTQSYTTRIPIQSQAFADQLNALSDARTIACDYEGETPPPDCLKASEKVFELYDSTSKFLTSFKYFKGGLEAGYETDQQFEAKQSTFGVFFYGQYEDWGTHSWAGTLKVTPSLRLAVDRVDPNDDTPRAQAGDNSPYYRFSGDVSAWVPLGTFYDRVVVLTANFRHYSENF